MCAPDFVPVVEDGVHLWPFRVVGHGELVAGVVYSHCSVIELQDGCLAAGVGYAPVESGDSASVESRASDGEIMFLEHGHNLVGGGVHVEKPCHKDRQGDGRTAVLVSSVIYSSLAEQSVYHKPFLVHALGDAAVVADGVYCPVFRCPFHAARLVVPLFTYSGRIDIEVGRDRCLPV